MLSAATAGAGVVALGKRMAGQYREPPPGEPPVVVQGAVAVLFIAIAVFLVFVNYTLTSVFTTLAMVEDPDPSPAYAALTHHGDDEEGAAAAATGASNSSQRKPDDAVAAGPLTSSVRATARHLYSAGGLRMLARGFGCYLVVHLIPLFFAAVLVPVPALMPLGTLLATLATCHLQAVWVHVVISARNTNASFWSRLPRFGRTFEATKYPVALYWLADTAVTFVPVGINSLHIQNEVAGFSLASISFIVCVVLFKVPALVALVRVQASLLPADESTIVAFDRSFGGRVGPEVVDGKGYVSVRDALASFSRASWVRLYKVFAKAFLINLAAAFLAVVVLMVSTHSGQ